MIFLALAIGVAVGAGDDESEWRPKAEKKTRTIRPLADDWDDETTPVKQTAKPAIRQFAAPPDILDKEPLKPGQWRAPGSKTPPSEAAKSKKPAAVVDDQIKKADALIEPDDVPPKKSPESVIVQTPTDDRNMLKPVPMMSLLELTNRLKSSEPPKALEPPTDCQTKTKNGPGPTASELPTLPKPNSAASSTDGPPLPKPMANSILETASAKPVEKIADAPAMKPVAASAPIPAPQPPKPMSPESAQPAPAKQSIPAPAPAPPKKVVESTPPTLQPAPIGLSAPPPGLMEHGVVDDSANVCLPLMDPLNAWRFEMRSFLLGWDQPGTGAFVRDGETGAGVLSGVDYDFKKQFAQQLSLERRIDPVTAVVLSGLMTETASQAAGAIVFGGLDLGIDGPGSGILHDFTGFSGRATSRLWKAEMDLVRYVAQRPDSPIRGRVFGGPQFIRLKETFGYRAVGGVGDAVFDTRTDDMLYGADIGAGVAFQPWYSNFGIDVSGRYGLFANDFDVGNNFYSPRSAIVVHGDDGTCRLATSAELNIEATLRIARNISLLAGWRLWHLQGIGRAVSQVPTNVASPTLVTTSSGHLFAHGLFVGASIGWGGVYGPDGRGGTRPYYLGEQ